MVVRHTSLVFSLCRRSGLPPHEAEDVCQEVFWHVFEALPGYRGEGRLSTWLYTVARRRIIDHLRSPSRRQVPSGAPGDETFPPSPAEATSPESEAAAAQARARVRAAVDGMDEPARSVLVAYYLAEVPVAEIARTLKLPEGTVKTHLHRARRALRERLRDLC
jgi:RNA polymerase sigma-70 factor (ECF subfamily)